MSEKRSGNRRMPTTPGSRRKVVVALLLVLTFVTGAGMLAQIAFLRTQKQPVETNIVTVGGNPSKEYIYAGSKLVATVEPTAVGGNDAEFVSMSAREDFVSPPIWVPIGTGSPFGIPGQNYLVRVTMRNTGTTTWTGGGGYKLGSQNPAGNTTWGVSRASLPAAISPGQQVTFEFGATKQAGLPPDFFNFQWQMVQDAGVGYFGEKTANGIVPGGAWLPLGAGDFATCVSQSVPVGMIAGENYSVSITMNNGGANAWWFSDGGQGLCRLGSHIPEDNVTWGLTRVSLPSKSVQPGENATFVFSVTAPSTPGEYSFQWMMVKEWAGSPQQGPLWFGTLTPTTIIKVDPS